jgi:maleylacetoacetate isomerase
VKLYGYYRSSTTFRVRIALNLKGLDWEYVPVNLLKQEHLTPEFTKISPYNGLPVLEVEGRRMVQSLAIIEWLDERFPHPPLLPSDPDAHVLAREFAMAIATDIHGVNNLRTLTYLRETFGADDEQVKAWSRHWMERTLRPLEVRMEAAPSQRGFPFHEPTLFECVLIPQVYNAMRWGVDLAPLPKIRALYDYALGHEAFRLAAPENQPDAPAT